MNIVRRLGDILLVVALALAPMVATAAEAPVIEKHH